MQGTSPTTGQSLKTSTSYLTDEILWGHRFQPCVTFDPDVKAYMIDHCQFNKTVEVLTPLCSARALSSVMLTVTIDRSLERSPFYRSVSSSGIGSGGSEQTEFGARKLSIIREYKSAEELRLPFTASSDEGEEEEVGERLQRDPKEIFDVESLIASLQNYLDECEPLQKEPPYAFTTQETDV